MTIHPKKQAGFSLLELIVALALGAVVGLFLMLVAVGGIKNLKHTAGAERLHANAVFVTDVLGTWIKKADLLTVTGPSALDVKLTDGTHKKFALDPVAQTVTLDDGAVSVLTTSDIKVTELTFLKLARSVRITMKLEQRAGQGQLKITTTIAQRN